MYSDNHRDKYTNFTKPNKALFLDRDGVLIDYIPYLSHPDQVKLPLGAGEIFKKWQESGYLLIVITNQSGIGRGYFTANDVELVHSKMCQEYERLGVYFQEIFICPHQPSDNCKCRKPSSYMLLQASEKYSIELSQSYFIGDAISDVECAINAGCNPIFLLTNRTLADAKNLSHTQASVQIVNELIETTKLIQH
ncbi:HAD family hydrolase [Anabaena sp. UHCC 0399]|uniref:D-glycero-alpha-D-manno-heptose-1,7-bisphosphate 7-phosphatase n=1 Tax=Anabaena sp. UHCC 0399 TaxID=3110238 RepID=UPI002B217592|nr:HAD family hydrolase [Anabaena sp. UHCC 0399]MEA5567841.1 HAD family hydrolase [Anabaena sp. UHCC 0399]